MPIRTPRRRKGKKTAWPEEDDEIVNEGGVMRFWIRILYRPSYSHAVCFYFPLLDCASSRPRFIPRSAFFFRFFSFLWLFHCVLCFRISLFVPVHFFFFFLYLHSHLGTSFSQLFLSSTHFLVAFPSQTLFLFQQCTPPSFGSFSSFFSVLILLLFHPRLLLLCAFSLSFFSFCFSPPARSSSFVVTRGSLNALFLGSRPSFFPSFFLLFSSPFCVLFVSVFTCSPAFPLRSSCLTSSTHLDSEEPRKSPTKNRIASDRSHSNADVQYERRSLMASAKAPPVNFT